MKASLFLTIILIGLTDVSAQIINGIKLNISDQGSGNNNVTGAQAGAIGGLSTVSGDYSFSVGTSNIVSGYRSMTVGSLLDITENCSLMVGRDIYAYSSDTVSETNNLYVGYSHSALNNTNSALIGGYSMFQSSTCSFVAGSGNTVTSATSSFVAGDSNVVTGKQIVLGTGLIAQVTDSASVVVGRYNKAQTAPPTGQPSQVFVVGVGTSSATANRKNGFEVYTDGTVKLGKRQGDVGMGRFGLPGDE